MGGLGGEAILANEVAHERAVLLLEMATVSGRAADVLLLVEVADTGLTRDRRGRTPLYPRAGINTVWFLDLSLRRPRRIFRHDDRRLR